MSFALGAVLGDAERYGDQPVLQTAVTVYGVVCAIQLLAVWTARLPRFHTLSPLADLVALCVFVAAGLDTSGPLFLLFALPLLSASVRWQGRGALWTAACLMGILTISGAHAFLRQDQSFEPTEFMVRLAWLGVAAVVVGELSRQEAFLHRGLRKLAAGPRLRAVCLEELARDLPGWAADVLNAPRALVRWEEADEPWVHLTWWQNGQWRYAREAPSSADTIAPELAEADFMRQSQARHVLRVGAGGPSWWRVDPLQPAFRDRFAIDSVLSARFDGAPVHGRVFIFDKPSMAVDDLVLAELVARQIGHRLNQCYLLQRLTEQVARDERVRLGRDLHDGALHVLAGIALELEGIVRIPNGECANPGARLRELQASVVAEQRTLRILIERLRASGPPIAPANRLLSVRLKDLLDRLERRWPTRMECSTDGVDDLPEALADEVYLIVHEALVNAARHADASAAAVSVSLEEPFVRIAVSDNGRGFPFKGLYTVAALTALRVGPATLKERTTALGGDLMLDSTDHGSRIEISLPVRSAQ